MLTIYKASAGSGKTYNLALSYIRHILGYPKDGKMVLRPYNGARVRRHKSILAITFTNAATEEMKSRIIRQLAQLATDPHHSDYIGKLTDEFSVDAQAIGKAAASALSELLYDYSNFYVSTIDSFFQTVLRTFAREVDQQGDYELSLEQKTIIPEVISLMLEELNRTPGHQKNPLYSWILRRSHDNSGSGKVSNYFDRETGLLTGMTARLDNALDEVYHSSTTALDEYLEDPSRLHEFQEEINRRTAAIYQEQKEIALKIKSILDATPFDKIKKELLRVILKAAENPSSITDKDLNLVTVKKFAESDDYAADIASKNAPFRKTVPQAVINEVAELSGNLFNLLFSARPVLELYALLYDGAMHLELLALFRKNLAEYLRENNTVLISDTGELLKRIISDSEMPFIYERLGMRLESLLIDEFQDTSKLQWHNLKPLVTNSISYAHSLIIGDVKQSIYRFRNSDSSLLDHIVQTDPAIKPFVEPRGTDPADNTNYRSAADMVRFNNTFFKRFAEIMDVSAYDGVIQEIAKSKEKIPACIKITAVNHIPGVTLQNKPDAGKNTAWRLDTLANDILDQHSRGYRWKDIAILVNTHRQAQEVVGYFLENHPDIRILSNEALLLSNSPSVRTVMSILSLVAQDIVENPEGKKEEEEVEEVKYHSKQDLTSLLTYVNYHRAKGLTYQDALQEALATVGGTGGAPLADRIRELRSRNASNLVALIEFIIMSELSEEERTSQIAFLTALQDRATAHCLGPDPSVAAFIRAYGNNLRKWAIKAPDNLDAVRVMTIHASKGLEWPCVHVPYASWQLYQTSELWYDLKDGIPADRAMGFEAFDSRIVPPILRLNTADKGVLYDSPTFSAQAKANKKAEEADNLNRLYVAFTRAGRELCAHFQDVAQNLESSTLAKALTVLTEWTDGEVPDRRLMPFSVSVVPADENHAELIEFSYMTDGAKPQFTGDGKDSDELLVKEPYVVVDRRDAYSLITVEDAFDLEHDEDIGNEEVKDIAGETLEQGDWTETLRQASIRGNHLHAVLAGMASRDDLDKALARVAVRARLDESTVTEYAGIIREAFEKMPRTQEWFDPRNKIWNEQSIFDPEGDDEEGMTFRPDRIVRRPDGSVVLVDYKFTTGKERSHAAQMRGYLDLMRRMGVRNAVGVLWYPLIHKTVDITI